MGHALLNDIIQIIVSVIVGVGLITIALHKFRDNKLISTAIYLIIIILATIVSVVQFKNGTTSMSTFINILITISLTWSLVNDFIKDRKKKAS